MSHEEKLDGGDRDGPTVRRYVVRGRVQGVGFRWWTRREARALNLSGSVFNRPDGAVEVFACGSTRALERFAARLDQGPPGARVEAVETHIPATAPEENPNSFQIVSLP